MPSPAAASAPFMVLGPSSGARGIEGSGGSGVGGGGGGGGGGSGGSAGGGDLVVAGVCCAGKEARAGSRVAVQPPSTAMASASARGTRASARGRGPSLATPGSSVGEGGPDTDRPGADLRAAGGTTAVGRGEVAPPAAHPLSPAHAADGGCWAAGSDATPLARSPRML